MYIEKAELMELLERKYGDLNDKCGCSVYVNGEYEWLSVKDIVDIINDCEEYDEAENLMEDIMIKLNKQVDSLENIIEKIERRIEELKEKRDALEENAFDEDRDMTKAEWNKFYKLEEQIEKLEEEKDEIENALDYLRDYTDY